jgi:hypothetical protein
VKQHVAGTAPELAPACGSGAVNDSSVLMFRSVVHNVRTEPVEVFNRINVYRVQNFSTQKNYLESKFVMVPRLANLAHRRWQKKYLHAAKSALKRHSQSCTLS